MEMKRIIAALLAVMMLVGSFLVFDISAAETQTEEEEEETIDYVKKAFASREEKLASMTMYTELHGYQLWADPRSGEVAWVDTASGQMMFTNPYNVAASNGSTSTKEELLSQVIIRYTDNNQDKYFTSYEEAALRNQIVVENIKNGIRVEYTIGRMENRILVPRLITKEKLETLILSYFTDNAWLLSKVQSFFQLQDPENCVSEKELQQLYTSYPIVRKLGVAVYNFASDASEVEMREVEGYIKQYCPHFTFETLDEVHSEVDYEATDRAPAIFRLAIEYTIDEWGVQYRVPFNGLRFDESHYQLTDIQILPYLGAGATPNDGYTFIPDGGGAKFDFADIKKVSSTTVTGQLYGIDYAYHTISGAHHEVMRLPVFGLVENIDETRTRPVEVVVVEESVDPVTGVVTPAVMGTKQESYQYTEDRGFVAIIEEGDALCKVSTMHGGALHIFHSVGTTIVPRPKDTYNLRDAISVGSNSTWTVVSERKYVGNYKVRIIMLTDPAIAEEKKLEDTYTTTYMGMLNAVRDYYFETGKLTRLTEEDVKADIPLYIESFGTIETLEKVLSIPVYTMTPLTTFENIKTMYDELAAEGITNINFRLTGFTKNGMYGNVANKLEWEKSVGGKSGFEDLVAYAKEKGFGVYPEFDFAYTVGNSLFDALNLDKHAIKTIDNRYTTKRYYSPTYQSFTAFGELALSPAYYNYFYEKLNAAYQKYDPIGISLSTIGTDLNSDFDEDEPYNREDNKDFTVEFLQKVAEEYAGGVMVDGGNAYTLPYVDHILNVPLDSSRYLKASSSIPFMGALLHGSVQFAGTPINMSGDIGYDFLKAIENGSYLYFTLSYQNTEKLKEDMRLSEYYSVRYDIWFEELVERYQALNEVVKDLQTKLIVDHEFLIGERVPDADELEADKQAVLDAEAEEKAKADEEARIAALIAEREKRLAQERGEDYVADVEEPEEDETTTEEPVEEPTEEEEGYPYTKYTSDDDRIVKVTYEGGIVFYLNYNNFPVTVNDDSQIHNIPEFGFIRIN